MFNFRDYYTIGPRKGDPLCGCKAKEPGLSGSVKRRIVDETGDHYRVATAKDNATSVLSGESYKPKRVAQQVEQTEGQEVQ
jgi:hypothetical protein